MGSVVARGSNESRGREQRDSSTAGGITKKVKGKEISVEVIKVKTL
jgi:hypothetical protein